MPTFAPEVESWNGWWPIFGCSSTSEAAKPNALNAIYSRMKNWERSPIRNPVSPQFPRRPLYKEILKILTKLQKENGLPIRQLALFYVNNPQCTKPYFCALNLASISSIVGIVPSTFSGKNFSSCSLNLSIMKRWWLYYNSTSPLGSYYFVQVIFMWGMPSSMKVSDDCLNPTLS